MPHPTPCSPPTGHPAIDEQHHQLDELILRLADICQRRAADDCGLGECPASSRTACLSGLDRLIGDLLCFLVDHFSYEEGLMRLLPDTPTCRTHIEAHTFAHAELSARLSELAGELDKANPRQCAERLQHILSSWMGGHNRAFDVALANSLEEASNAELKYDVELVNLMRETTLQSP